MRSTRRLRVSKPTSTRRSSANVRANNPAPTSNITAADVFTSNGVIHVVDKVILPK